MYESARDGYFPSCFQSYLGTSNNQDSPAGALYAHMFISLLLLILPPPGNAYSFLINVSAYPEVYYCHIYFLRRYYGSIMLVSLPII